MKDSFGIKIRENSKIVYGFKQQNKTILILGIVQSFSDNKLRVKNNFTDTIDIATGIFFSLDGAKYSSKRLAELEVIYDMILKTVNTTEEFYMETCQLLVEIKMLINNHSE